MEFRVDGTSPQSSGLFGGEADPTAIHQRILDSAERGLDHPACLSAQEIMEVCFAVIAFYAQNSPA